MNCKNCTSEIQSGDCPDCQQTHHLKRIDIKYIMLEIEPVLNFERGIFYTIKELLINPGKCIRTYLLEDRSKLLKPIIFIVITSLLYTLSVHFFDFDNGYLTYPEDGKSGADTILKWMNEHYGYANITIGVFVSFWISIFFRKHQYNIFEIFVLSCYLMGFGMLVLAVFGMVEGVTHLKITQFGAIISFIYIFFGIGDFFGKKKITNYIKAILAYAFGTLTFALTVFLLGGLIDLLKQYFHN